MLLCYLNYGTGSISYPMLASQKSDLMAIHNVVDFYLLFLYPVACGQVVVFSGLLHFQLAMTLNVSPLLSRLPIKLAAVVT
jgi:hypothetical protein